MLAHTDFSRVRSLPVADVSDFERCQSRVGQVLALTGSSCVRPDFAPSAAKMKSRRPSVPTETRAPQIRPHRSSLPCYHPRRLAMLSENFNRQFLAGGIIAVGLLMLL